MTARQYWTVLREDRVVVAGVVIVCLVAVGLLAALLPRTYTSTAVFYVSSSQSAPTSTDSYQGAQLSSERVKSYTELLGGERVAADASALLGGTPSPGEVQQAISADATSETVVLTLSVTEDSPAEAQRVARAVSTAFTRLVASVESNGQTVDRPIVSTEVVLPPTLPLTPSGPGLRTLLAVGLLVGLILGIATALVRRALRRAIDTPAAVVDALDAPVVGVLPADRRRPRVPAILAEPPPGTGGRGARRLRSRAESVRRMRTAVRTLAGDRRCLVVTGVAPGQRTTTTAVDLAVALAAVGETVLLVDADLRDPSIAPLAGLDPTGLGLSEVLAGAASPVAATRRWAAGDLDVLTAGAPSARPNELLGRAGPTLRALRDRYDRIVVDTPAATACADAVDVAQEADGVLLVLRRGVARPDQVAVTTAALQLVETPVVGGVLTDAVDVPPAARSVAPPDMRALPPGTSGAPVDGSPGPSGPGGPGSSAVGAEPVDRTPSERSGLGAAGHHGGLSRA